MHLDGIIHGNCSEKLDRCQYEAQTCSSISLPVLVMSESVATDREVLN